ncbi:hypothetical protein [Paraburkholderia tropica]|nr:hypothetical protein [Paraburkholderia tropica]OBR46601.1 hypothetical protein A6456_29285 [Paraburkholderia tropica]RQN34016.1 hypothetical protein EHZ25_36820 [Paraburkholderia tropica]
MTGSAAPDIRRQRFRGTEEIEVMLAMGEDPAANVYMLNSRTDTALTLLTAGAEFDAPGSCFCTLDPGSMLQD